MKVVIESFQSIAKAALSLTGLSVIVGPSNYGKSAVLRAIEGALFNRPGEHIVRKGAKNAMVSVSALPQAPIGAVIWTKGTVNKYVIDGIDYTRVGSGAPQPLQDAGYRDVWVGDRDKKKGESIRPQVAGQFDPPLFPLSRSESFVADVLGLMSRHHVVATAQDRCASDLRSSKQRLGVRKTDLETLAGKRAVLDVTPVIDDAARAAWVDRISTQTRALVAVRTALQQRAARRAIPSLPPTPVGVVAASLQTGAHLATVRQLRHDRQVLQQVPVLPAEGVRDVAPVLTPAKVVAGTRRRRLLALVREPSTAPFPVVLPQAVDALRAVVAQRRTAMDTLYTANAAVHATRDAVDEAQDALTTALAALAVCPTCERPMAQVL